MYIASRPGTRSSTPISGGLYASDVVGGRMSCNDGGDGVESVALTSLGGRSSRASTPARVLAGRIHQAHRRSHNIRHSS